VRQVRLALERRGVFAARAAHAQREGLAVVRLGGVDAAARVLVPGGWLLVEIGPTVVAAAEAAVAARPELAAEPTLRDLAARPRIVQARRR
jgi:methylase of polypeptide subunit release factors